MAKAKAYYAVKVGRKPGIYTTWAECKAQTDGIKNSVFKKFATKIEAETFFNSDTNEELAPRPKAIVYYAVRVGRKPGIYTSWAECKEQTDGMKAVYHKFNTKEEAEAFLAGKNPEFVIDEKKKQVFYAVRIGKKPGVYTNWQECQANIVGFPNADFKKFDSLTAAETYFWGDEEDIAPLMEHKNYFYAIKYGIHQGIYTDWDECKKLADEDENSLVRRFKTEEEAQAFLEADQEAVTRFEEKENIYYAYVDGSYWNGKYGWGMVIHYNGETILEANGYGDDPEAACHHNVAGEVLGAMEAVKWAAAMGENIVLCYDYNGIAQWATGDWKRNKAFTMAYYEFMQPHLANVKFQKIAGHTGVPGNERADQLAKEAIAIN